MKSTKALFQYFFPTENTLFLKRWLGVSLLFHLLAAFCSIGYQAADEQFQILEFLSYKLGQVPVKDLAVEFPERMRPWIQPGIYFLLTKVFQTLGVATPPFLAMAFRVFTGVLGWMSAVALAECSLLWFSDKRTQRFAILTAALIWYFPVLHVRPSSESLGGSAFVLGLCLLFHSWKTRKNNVWIWLLGGGLLGLGFEARFQIGLMIFGAALWFLIVAKLPLRKFLIVGGGFLLVFLVGRLVDRWGYGDWNFSPWNYFTYNILRGEVSRYGQAPWWDIFRMSITESWPILGIGMAFCAVVAWIRHPLHLLTWASVPFFIIHECIAHKEYRFFFPIASLGPVLLILSLVSSKTLRLPSFPKKGWPRPVAAVFVGFLILNNTVGLFALSTVALSRTIQYQEAVFHYRPQDSANFRLYTQNRDPFEILGTPTHFYRPADLEVLRFQRPEELTQVNRPFWLFDPHFTLDAQTKQMLPFCHQLFRTVPEWVQYLNWNHWLDRTNVWALYRCD